MYILGFKKNNCTRDSFACWLAYLCKTKGFYQYVILHYELIFIWGIHNF